MVKKFSSVTALDHVDFDVLPSEVVAPVGHNGAGKSALLQALSGVHSPNNDDLPPERRRSCSKASGASASSRSKDLDRPGTITLHIPARLKAQAIGANVLTAQSLPANGSF